MNFQHTGDRPLTVTGVSRPIGMKRPIGMRLWRRIAMAGALACGFASVKVMANPNLRRPVAQFIYFYERSDDMNLWERVVFSCLLTKTSAATGAEESY